MKIIRKGRPIRKYTYVFLCHDCESIFEFEERENFRKSCAVDLFIGMGFITAPVLFVENLLCGVVRK